MEIKIYGSNECPYCNSLKKYLKILRVPFNYVDVDLQENEKEYLSVINKLGHYNIPVIKINDKFMSPEVEFESIPEAVKKVFKEYQKFKKEKVKKT